MAAVESIVTPGQRLGGAEQFAAGEGTYVREGSVVASLVGQRVVRPPADAAALPTLLVTRLGELPALTPYVGAIVTCRVRSINQRFAKADILCIGATPLEGSFSGMIRVQDVRATEKDTIEIYKSFRPGDIVQARVISLGDVRSYYLSTAENELGVVSAKSVAGGTLVPASWHEMQCSITGAKEYRKVAKIVDTAPDAQVA